MLKIELACALSQDVLLIPLQLPDGATVGDAIEQSGLHKLHPELFPLAGSIGIFGKLCDEDTLVREGDRIEIYRPLRADPKEARRNRAKHRDKAES